MKRRRGTVRSSEHRSSPSPAALATEGTMLPTGRIPADDARDAVALQELAWLAAPTGYGGFAFVALAAVVMWIRAIVVDLVAWILRGLMGHGRHGLRV
jgi:hypothetical protein